MTNPTDPMIPPVVRASRAQAEPQTPEQIVGRLIVGIGHLTGEEAVAIVRDALEAAVLAECEAAARVLDAEAERLRAYPLTVGVLKNMADQIRARGAGESHVPQEPTP